MLDEDGTEGAAEEAQAAELVRRMRALEPGEIASSTKPMPGRA